MRRSGDILAVLAIRHEADSHADNRGRHPDAFDANNDGFLSADEYWSASAWARIDVNRNGRIDANEWDWWPM